MIWRQGGYTERILNICINYANYIKEDYKTQLYGHLILLLKLQIKRRNSITNKQTYEQTNKQTVN